MLVVQVLFVFETNYALFLIWMQFVVYLLHQFEEYVLPGGFVAFFNTKPLGSKQANFPLDEKASFWINIPIVFVAYPLSAIFAGCLDVSLGIWTAYFSVINAISHVGMFFKYRYNPGLVVSTFINIPVGVYTIYFFASQHLISGSAHLAGLAVGLFMQGAVMIYGFKVLKPKVK